MWSTLLTAVVGILLLMSAWFAVQAYVRKRKMIDADRDVLEHVTHGCGACDQADSCAVRKEEECRTLSNSRGPL